MNALVTIDISTLTPATVFAPGGVEAIISKIEAEVSTEVFSLDTAEGRERIKSVAYKVARSKTALDDMGKDLVSGIKAQAATIDAERRVIRERLDALKDRVRGPLTAWEDAEDERISGHEVALVNVVEAARFVAPPTAEMVRVRIHEVAELSLRDWQEFKERADVAMRDAMVELGRMKAEAEQREADAAELAELRRLKVEREAADQARLIEEARATRAAQETEAAADRERQRAEQEKAREIVRAERVEAEKVAAAGRAVEMERQRVANIAAADKAEQEKREASQRHRRKIHKAITVNFCSRGFSEIEASNIVAWLAGGEILHVRIEY